MPIIRNPRVDDTFENENIKCSICNSLNSYLYYLAPHYNEINEINLEDPSSLLVCKGCLNNFINEIDEALSGDIKSAKLEERRF